MHGCQEINIVKKLVTNFQRVLLLLGGWLLCCLPVMETVWLGTTWASAQNSMYRTQPISRVTYSHASRDAWPSEANPHKLLYSLDNHLKAQLFCPSPCLSINNNGNSDNTNISNKYNNNNIWITKTKQLLVSRSMSHVCTLSVEGKSLNPWMALSIMFIYFFGNKWWPIFLEIGPSPIPHVQVSWVHSPLPPHELSDPDTPRSSCMYAALYPLSSWPVTCIQTNIW